MQARISPSTDTFHCVLVTFYCVLVDENPEHLFEQFIKVLTEKQETIILDVLRWHPYTLDFQMLPVEVKNQWK